MPKKKQGSFKVTVYPDWCKGCGICVQFCPAKVLELDRISGKAVVARQENCIHCSFCELHCPDFAVVVEDLNDVQE